MFFMYFDYIFTYVTVYLYTISNVFALCKRQACTFARPAFA